MAALAALIGAGLVQGYSAIKNSQAQREQADFQADQDKFNANIAGLQADDAIARGEEAAQNAGMQTKQLKGTQKAALAGSGVAVDSGSAADLLSETDKFSTLDILNIKNNAAREAFGYKAQAVGFSGQSEMTRKAGRSAANSTLLTGGANVLTSTAGAITRAKKLSQIGDEP